MIMEDALIHFYYQFHKNQHYFLCHDILEEAWKAYPSFSKNDAVVSLILFATACYHYRRGNHKGALKSYEKSLSVISNAADSEQLHLDIHHYKKLIRHQITSLRENQPFVPVKLPLETSFNQYIKKVYPNYIFTSFVISEPYIVHHHLKRDRSEVIQAREEAKQLRHKKLQQPYHTLKDQ